MLPIIIPEAEGWDPVNERFIQLPETRIELEHSLISLSKWESKHHKAFLDPNVKITVDEMLDYFRCMTLNKNVDPNVYSRISTDQVAAIKEYIGDPMTGQTFYDDEPRRPSMKIWTAERFYYAISSYQLDWRVEKWHLNRLFALIRFCSNEHEAADPTNKNRGDVLRRHASLNQARRAAAAAKR